MADGITDQLGTIILASGGLGIAAYGVIDGAKLARRIGLIGYRHVTTQLGPIMEAVRRAYGRHTDRLLEAQYRGGRGQGELPRTLRQGYRIGLTALAENAIVGIANSVGVASSDAIVGAAEKLRAGGVLESSEREALSRFEVAVDARIEAALCLAETDYVAGVKLLAGALAVAIALIVGWLISVDIGSDWFLKALLVGLIAVPIAPVAKDLATAVGEAARALRGR